MVGKPKRKGKRPLAAEVSEYTSLLHALKAADTLDITAQLTRPQVSATANHPRDADPAAAATGTVASTPSPTKTTDACDRWPLLLQDVYVPEWTFRDEVRLLASQTPHTILSKEEEVDDLDEEGPTSDALTDAASRYLSEMLSTIAEHVPMTAKSMQNRLTPLGWESVLQIVSASRLVDEEILSNVIERMEAIFGESGTTALDRFRVTAARRQKTDDFISRYGKSFLKPLKTP